MVDLRELAVARSLRGGERNVCVPFDLQLEDRRVIAFRFTKRSNDHMGIDGFREGEKLDR